MSGFAAYVLLIFSFCCDFVLEYVNANIYFLNIIVFLYVYLSATALARRGVTRLWPLRLAFCLASRSPRASPRDRLAVHLAPRLASLGGAWRRL